MAKKKQIQNNTKIKTQTHTKQTKLKKSLEREREKKSVIIKINKQINKWKINHQNNIMNKKQKKNMIYRIYKYHFYVFIYIVLCVFFLISKLIYNCLKKTTKQLLLWIE